MADPTSDTKRLIQPDSDVSTFKVGTGATIYRGMALEMASDGTVVPFTSDGNFVGFAIDAGVADEFIEVQIKGRAQLTVANSGSSAPGVAVYAGDSNTFDVATATGTQIGALAWQVSGTTWWVSFEAFFLAGQAAADDGV